MLRIIVSILALTLAANCADAAKKPKNVKPKEPVAKVACWQRVYSPADLAKHRRQKVAMVQLTLETQGDGAVSAVLGLNLRKRVGAAKYDYGISGSCQPSGQTMDCIPEWNAGSFILEKGARGGLRVKNRKLQLNPYGDNTPKVSAKAVNFRKSDDAIWLLFPANPAVCAAR